MFYSIQGLRAVAALLVVAHHYNETLIWLAQNKYAEPTQTMTIGNLSYFGGIGVPIFFAISGFIMGIRVNVEGGPYDFLARRVARIVPIYWTMTVATVLFHPNWTWPQLLASMGFVRYVSGMGHAVIGPGWTLEFEMVFYLAMTLVFLVLLAGRPAWQSVVALTAIFAAMAIAGLVIGKGAPPILSPILLEFCAGLLIAQIYRIEGVRRLWPLFLSTALILIGVAVFAPVSWTYMRPIWSILSFFLMLGLVTAEQSGVAPMSSAPFQVLGNASYSIYVSHRFVQFVLFTPLLWSWSFHTVLHPDIALLLMIVIATVFGVGLHYMVERPLNAWVLGALRRRKPTGATAAEVRTGTP